MRSRLFPIHFAHIPDCFPQTFCRTLGSAHTYTWQCTHVHLQVYACTLPSVRREVGGKELKITRKAIENQEVLRFSYQSFFLTLSISLVDMIKGLFLRCVDVFFFIMLLDMLSNEIPKIPTQSVTAPCGFTKHFA